MAGDLAVMCLVVDKFGPAYLLEKKPMGEIFQAACAMCFC